MKKFILISALLICSKAYTATGLSFSKMMINHSIENAKSETSFSDSNQEEIKKKKKKRRKKTQNSEVNQENAIENKISISEENQPTTKKKKKKK